MNTNAGARDEAWWSELANTFGRSGAVIFSVDGLRDTNHLYRQNVVWDNVERSMRAFIGAGGLGEPIVTGLALNNTDLILQGAIPAACGIRASEQVSL